MFQRVNLYREKQYKKIILPVKQILIINLVILTVLFLDTVYVFYDYYNTQTKLKKLKDSQAKLNQGLEVAQKSIPTEEQKEKLQIELLELQKLNKYKKKMFATFNQLHHQDYILLSKYLHAMAEQTIDDVWITKFSLKQNGQKISLSGRALNSSSIPRYLEQLGTAAIFSKKSFENIEIALDEETKQVIFNIGALNDD